MEEIKTYEDFSKLRDQLERWKRRFPMFKHDVKSFETSLEEHMKQHMEHLIRYKQSKKRSCLEKAQEELDHINRILTTISKIELMALLSKG